MTAAQRPAERPVVIAPGQAAQSVPGQTVRRPRGSLPPLGSSLQAIAQSPVALAASDSTANTAIWQPVGPSAVASLRYGLVTGRVTALALDPSDTTGNTLYVGTTGGGVWVAHNAATSDLTKIVFSPLTEMADALRNTLYPSDSIGALSVQPGGTGVILAGTGDTNDALDSYYGTGILRSTDGGQTWTLIRKTADLEGGQGTDDLIFIGEGIAGFAWSTMNPQVVVAAVAQAYEGQLVGAESPRYSYSGLYYSNDSGETWHLARILDGNGAAVQGPLDAWSPPDGNGATAVVWNPVRKVFIAAVRLHGYYQSADGVIWTRLQNQPGVNLTSKNCPTNSALPGSPKCPIWRGALTVNPQTGDTFAWTVDLNNQDQGIWQDACTLADGRCGNSSITFAKSWNSAFLQPNTAQGSSTILAGDYALSLSAIPQGQDTILLAGSVDLWRCSLGAGCTWRNTTHSLACSSAEVAPFQHGVEWNSHNPQEVFIGNDGGLWRSMDAAEQTGADCAESDADHFQNLNGGLGSLAEVKSLSRLGDSPYSLMAGLGINGTAGVKSFTGLADHWPQVLGGEGGPVAIDPTDPDKWYVNNGAGVSIHLCAQQASCVPGDFGASAVVGDVDVGGEGAVMALPAPFLLDPLDPSHLLVGTCRVWRGPASGNWTASNAVSLPLDGTPVTARCSGAALIRSMAAQALPGGGEVVYVGTYGALNGGATRPGHVFSATMTADGQWSAWRDLTENPTNELIPMNWYGFDVSGIAVDPHDTTGNTVYVTIAAFLNPFRSARHVYRTTDGGLHWAAIVSNLPISPANDVAVDPLDANTVYVATDRGVYVTRQVSTCADLGVSCWAALGAGLPIAPVTALKTSPASSQAGMLVAATYGRGIWQIPLLSGGAAMTEVTVDPANLVFDAQPRGTTSAALGVTVKNTGSAALSVTSVAISGDFAATNDCTKASVAPGASCLVQVTFSPTLSGARTGQLKITGNVTSGVIAVALSGTGEEANSLSLQPASLDFGKVETGNSSNSLAVTVENSSDAVIPITSLNITGPFELSANSCGTQTLSAHADCVLEVLFHPVDAGAASGAVTLVDSEGTQTVQLAGVGTAAATDSLSPTSLSFPETIVGQASTPLRVVLANAGENPLTSISVSASDGFRASSNCTAQLTGGMSCQIDVVFQPAAEGVQSGSLTVADILKTQTVPLTGTAVVPPAIAVIPASLSFSDTQVGVASAPLAVSVVNTGGASMENVGFQLTGAGAASFATSGGTCGTILKKTESCTTQVIFKPAAAGQGAATLTVSSSTAGVRPVSIALNGIGQSAAGLSVLPTELKFEAEALGYSSAAQSVRITNAGGTDATALTLATSGPFLLVQNTCALTLAPSASCTTGVIFTPTQTGVQTGALTVKSASVEVASTVELSGVGGLSGILQVQPAQLRFGTAGVSAKSAAFTVTLTNTSNTAPLSALTLAVTSEFQVEQNACGTSVPPGATCTIAVTFSPAAAGPRTGTLTISSSALAASAVVPLSGTGFDFTASAQGAGTLTVAGGQTATFSITLNPAAGLSGSFIFQCGNLPAYAGCVFNPSTNTVAAGATGSETLQITTAENSAAREHLPASGEKVMEFAGLLLVFPLLIRKRRRALLFFAALAVVAGVVSCASSGGGGGSVPPADAAQHVVAAGSYSIPLVVSSNGVSHTVTLTLVVD